MEPPPPPTKILCFNLKRHKGRTHIKKNVVCVRSTTYTCERANRRAMVCRKRPNRKVIAMICWLCVWPSENFSRNDTHEETEEKRMTNRKTAASRRTYKRAPIITCNINFTKSTIIGFGAKNKSNIIAEPFHCMCASLAQATCSNWIESSSLFKLLNAF